MGKLIFGLIVIFLVVFGSFLIFNKPTHLLNQISSFGADETARQLSRGKCVGTEKRKLTTLPMKIEDFSMIIPYGLVVGDHVTPIDHQYFSPTVFRSPRDTYEVMVMADATIVDIQPRVKPEYTEYRLVFSISCKLFYYYDLVTSLSPDIKVGVAVKAGQVIGRIGGQTLDFAVWDMDVTLKGFVVPEHYKGEPWKIHTVDPLDYYTDDLKKQALSKYLRSIPPVSGKIDYDIDGKLIGNWFIKDSNGYEGIRPNNNPQGYSRTHFSIAPNHLDPSVYIISFGDFAGEFKQFAKGEGAPDPKLVSVDTGLVRYELYPYGYKKENGERWDHMTFTQNPRVDMNSASNGCVLIQMQTGRTMKLEAFPNQSCQSVSAFSSKAKVYER